MSVVIRRVKTALQTEYRRAGGIRIHEAIERASENLSDLSEACNRRIDVALAQVIELTADPGQRLLRTDLLRLHGLVNDMLACCATVEIDGFVDALYAVARLVAALLSSDVWLDGALVPAANLLRLARRGAIPAADLRPLIAGVDRCADHVGAQARSRGRATADLVIAP